MEYAYVSIFMFSKKALTTTPHGIKIQTKYLILPLELNLKLHQNENNFFALEKKSGLSIWPEVVRSLNNPIRDLRN